MLSNHVKLHRAVWICNVLIRFINARRRQHILIYIIPYYAIIFLMSHTCLVESCRAAFHKRDELRTHAAQHGFLPQDYESPAGEIRYGGTSFQHDNMPPYEPEACQAPDELQVPRGRGSYCQYVIPGWKHAAAHPTPTGRRE